MLLISIYPRHRILPLIWSHWHVYCSFSPAGAEYLEPAPPNFCDCALNRIEQLAFQIALYRFK